MSVVLEFSTLVYRMDAIKKAAYRMGARCSAVIELDGTNARVTLQPRPGISDHESLVADFQTEVLDQELREVVAKETEAIRNVILAQAFSKTALLEEMGESGDFKVDPLNIRMPDER